MFWGSAFLLGSLKHDSMPVIFLSFLFFSGGVICAVSALRLRKRSLYLFLAAFFIQIGLFLLLSALHLFPVPFSKAWPFLSIFSGLALFPTGWHRYGVLKTNYIVSSVAFMILGSVLLLFSFDMVSFSFAQFVLNWWPLIIILAGLVLVLLALATKDTQRNTSS
ncbi:MAG: DUF5668 domain-containing protein [Spirochaetaceae bacterium]|jgi:hypothetical protein|nr:DUF5668 domain-containing protein [Spirochaetaceae bacterium]